MQRIDREGWAVEATGLVKEYRDGPRAVDGVDLAIGANTVYGLLGPNGAGKTTLISLLTTLLEPTAGRAHVASFDVVSQAAEVRRRIGVTFQEMVLDDELTGRQVLDYHGRLYGLDGPTRRARIEQLLDLVELGEVAGRRARTYSGGMKRRLELARALMTTPEVLFLDEPTLGLDPQTRSRVWQYVRDLKSRDGMTVLLTTHYMEEAEALADRVGILDQGRLLVEGTPPELVAQMGVESIAIAGSGDRAAFVRKVEALSFVQTVAAGPSVTQIGVDQGSRRLVDVIAQADGTGFAIDDVTVAKPSLGDVFLKYTGRQLRD